ncbi:MAG TPA: fumarylacetoacetate hydrolase family protein [Flavisolibacter sp.]|jgi:2-keto-4-pentenoate hydratase/2-oxohepta-3-ene-1,7-dioic acid hydratase in catechol pathway|nr:fumarylacetoacetate hydrolase family protein [Flavisolibacter sp.]
MKLFRYRKGGEEKPGVVIHDRFYDVSAFGEDYGESFFAKDGLSRLQAFLEKEAGNLSELEITVEMAAPFQRPSKIICIGLNYTDHARETGAALPAEPILFMKATTSFTGPNDNIVIPRGSEKTDWEVELCVVIGKKASYVDESEAMDYVAGYCLHNDVSEREYQLERGGTWDKGKGCDSFAPMGPFLVTKDSLPDENNLRLWLKVNGQMMQDGNTANLLFKVPFLVSYISQFMTLLPGDVISTGTPAGVGLGMNPQVYLKEGDVVELGIDGLGEARQNVVAWQK